MIYPFRCQECGRDLDYPVHNPSAPSPCCGARLKRVWHHVATRRDMAPHWNNAVGGYVRNLREFDDALKRKSDEMSERLGKEHRFRRVDWADAAAAGGVTEDGLDATRKAQRDTGKDEPTRRLFT